MSEFDAALARPLLPGRVVSVREDGARLIFDRLDEDGQEWGHVEVHGSTYPSTLLLSILIRGNWKPPAD